MWQDCANSRPKISVLIEMAAGEFPTTIKTTTTSEGRLRCETTDEICFFIFFWRGAKWKYDSNWADI